MIEIMSDKQNITFGLVIPCYNEAQRLDVQAFSDFVDDNPNGSLLFVDDGSSDGTVTILEKIREKGCGRARYIRLDQNSGKSEAVRQGVAQLLATDIDIVGFWDADLATPLDEVHGMLGCLSPESGVACVTGARIKRLGANIERRWYRHYLGRVIATFISLILGLPTYDTQCGAKIFTREIANEIFTKPFLSRWLFDVELFARIKTVNEEQKVHLKVHELPLTTWRDVGASKINPLYLLKVPYELLRIARHYRH